MERWCAHLDDLGREEGRETVQWSESTRREWV